MFKHHIKNEMVLFSITLHYFQTIINCNDKEMINNK